MRQRLMKHSVTHNLGHEFALGPTHMVRLAFCCNTNGENKFKQYQTQQGYVRAQEQWSSLQRTPRVLERRAVCPAIEATK